MGKSSIWRSEAGEVGKAGDSYTAACAPDLVTAKMTRAVR